MKRISCALMAATIVLGIIACNTQKGSQQTAVVTDTHAIVGADQDEHGCKASAGYTWSEIKGECIRIWEVGSKLTYTQENQPQAETMYVVFTGDSTQLETFGANHQLWTRTDNSTSWTSADKKQCLEQTHQGWILR